MCDLCFCNFNKDRIKSYQIQHVLFRSRKSGTIPIHGFIRVPGRSREVPENIVASCRFVSLPVAFAQDGGYRGVRLRAISSEDIENGTRKFDGNIVLPGKPWGNRETNDFFFKWVLQLHPQIWHYYEILSHCTSESLAMAPHTALMFVLLICCCFSCDCLTFLRYCCHNHKGLLHSRISCDDQRRRWWGRWMWLGARWF